MCDKNNRGVLVMRNATQFLAQLDAVHARHVDVEENQVKGVVVQQVESCTPVRCTDRVVVGPLKSAFISHVANRVVVHLQNPGFRRGVGRPGFPVVEQAAETIHCLNQGLNRGGRHSVVGYFEFVILNLNGRGVLWRGLRRPTGRPCLPKLPIARHSTVHPEHLVEQHGLDGPCQLSDFPATRQTSPRTQEANTLIDLVQLFLTFLRTDDLGISAALLLDGSDLSAPPFDQSLFQLFRQASSTAGLWNTDQLTGNGNEFGRGAFGFCQRFVAASPQGFLGHIGKIGVRKDQNWRGFMTVVLADCLQQLESAKLRQHQIQDDQIGGQVRKRFKRSHRIDCRRSPESCLLQAAAVQVHRGRVIAYQESSFGVRRSICGYHT